MKKNNLRNKTIRTDQKFSVSMVITATIGMLAIGVTATTMHPTQVQASPIFCFPLHI